MELSNIIRQTAPKSTEVDLGSKNLRGAEATDYSSEVSRPVEPEPQNVEVEKAEKKENFNSFLDQTEKVREAVKSANDFYPNRVKFDVDDDSGQVVVRVIDKNTEEVVRQIPPEEFLKIADKVKVLNRPQKGLVVDQAS